MSEGGGKPTPAALLVIGVGNPDAGDDAAGREVARRLAALEVPGVEVEECDGGAAALLQLWDGRDHVVLVDAAHGEGKAGTVHVFDAAAEPLPACLLASDARASSHGLGPAHAMELARVLGRLPKRLTVYAVEGASFEVGRSARLSAAVERAVARLVDELAHSAAAVP